MELVDRSRSDIARRLLPVGIAFTIGVVLYASDIYTLAPGPTDGPLGLRFAVLAVMSGTLYFRRSAPILAFWLSLVPLAVDAWGGPTLPVWLIATDVLYALALYGTRRQSNLVVAGSGVGSVLTIGIVALTTRDPTAVVLAIVAAAAFVGTPVWWARSIRSHKELAAMERERAAAVGTVAELDRKAAVAEERARMARDLHDVIAGHLSAIAIQSEAAARVIGTDAARPILASIRANSTDALDEMRSMIGLLRDANPSESLTAPGRLTQLDALVESARMTGARVTVDSRIGCRTLPAAVDHAAYRITQEALTNATKHAPAQHVSVGIGDSDETLTLRICNTLPGAADEKSTPLDTPRAGLSNMRERATLLGGTFRAGRTGSMWTVEASLPLNHRTPGATT